jgi:hypothetical protein
MTAEHQVSTDCYHHHIDRHVDDGERVTVHEEEAPAPQDPSDAREGDREPQTGLQGFAARSRRSSMSPRHTPNHVVAAILDAQRRHPS